MIAFQSIILMFRRKGDMIRKLYRYVILPRMCFVPYFFTKALLSVLALIYWVMRLSRKQRLETNLCIEAGVKGWDSIEFKELYQSACEYLPPKCVHRLVVLNDQSYLEQITKVIQSKTITHYVYDPRTNNADNLFWPVLWNCLRVSILLQKNGVVPIVLLTDLSLRIWRTQAAIVSARSGIVVCFISPKHVGQIFPHQRLLGPSLMPFSVQTVEKLNKLISLRQKNKTSKVLFTGSLYEPRTTKLGQIRAGLASRGINLEIKGRQMGSARIPDSDYWARLC